ncbi:MAG TPA: hypothetical protein PLR22_04460 [Saprospiraceae bacterium]|nr:MAG: hypothetical protein HWD63_02680 [Candidatus Parvibacillus calidus]HPB52898.1 hypothetical protein [Saprospiraceae bacterium]
MTKLLFLILILASNLTFGQSGYERAMTRGIQMIKNAKVPEDMNRAEGYFEQIAGTEKNQWLPYYYAAFTKILTAYLYESSNKDYIAHKAESMIFKADSLQPDNSEIYCLKHMVASLAFQVDPGNRWLSYGVEAGAALDKAKRLDPSNPRPYVLEGLQLMNAPGEYGGSKEKAKVAFKKALDLFENFKPISDIAPSWGLEQAKTALEGLD